MSNKTEKDLRLIEQRNEENAERRRMEAAHGTEAMVATVRDLIWDKAWEDGHSEGYHRVEDIYEDLADLAKLAVREAVSILRATWITGDLTQADFNKAMKGGAA
jgi:hypothetical protein